MVRLITEFFDSSLDQLVEVSSGSKWAFHLFVAVVNTMLSIPNVIAYFLLDANTHVVFWMGLAPTYILLLVPITLFCLSLCLPVLNFIRMGSKSVKSIVFMCFFVAGTTMSIAGVFVLLDVHKLMGDLDDSCGQSKLTRAIQLEWQRLSEFHHKCEVAQKKHLFVDECPGFQKTRKGHEFFVDYIEQMEEEYSCRGFCKAAPRPLFLKRNDYFQGADARCASSISEEMKRLAIIVCVPTMCSGVFIFIVGQCLLHYDHL